MRTRHVTPQQFRAVLKRVPTSVVAITAHDGAPTGVAVGSFSSISLAPALVGFFISRESTTWPRIERAGHFAANLLGGEHVELCRRFARPGEDRFDGVPWSPGLLGAPLLDDALAWIECEIDQVLVAGDHLLVIGAVHAMRAAEAGRPLVFFGGEFVQLAA
jgi:3-hydroxy-9,10-secoandrosta-1,3,5(10)-triene-9,17-dione monooxygenase reductase component